MPARIATISAAAVTAAALLIGTASFVSQAATTLEAGHARCVMCHAEANNAFRLERLPEGQATWTDERSRKNYDTVVKLVQAADDPLTSKMLTHPLAPEAGGDAFHSGGRQFANKNDPNWKTIAAWAKGATLAPGKK